MKKTAVIFIVFLVALGACSKDEIMVYNADSYIQFVKNYADSSSFTFVSVPGETTYSFPVEVELVGRLKDADREYKVEVLENYTTAPASSFRLPGTFTLKGGKPNDTFNIELINSPDLQQNSIRLALQVTPHGQFKVGETERSVFILWFTDRIAKPDWWTNVINNSFLGAYSDKKYKLFIEVTGVGDMTGMSYYEMRLLTMQFKTYLREQEEKGPEHIVYEADGITKMTVALIGG